MKYMDGLGRTVLDLAFKTASEDMHLYLCLGIWTTISKLLLHIWVVNILTGQHPSGAFPESFFPIR